MNYFKPFRNGQNILIKREFELSELRNRGVLLYIHTCYSFILYSAYIVSTMQT